MTGKTYKEIATMIESIGLPYAYYQFEKDTAKPPPFICFYYSGNDPFSADNTNYVKVQNLVIELYTEDKRFDIEEQLENLLTENEIVFEHYETYIDTEKMFMQTYEMEVIVNGRD